MKGEPPLSHTRIVAAPAKLNVFLRVHGRRPDGYHDLETLVVPISLADGLEIHAHSDPSRFRTLSLSLQVSGEPALTKGIPVDDSNLVLRAAAALADRAGVKGFADILLEKRVPSAAGLGGGSSDAAVTLRALNELWDCGLGENELRAIAAEIGSDVPALLEDGGALASGRGELVQTMPARSFRWALVTFPFGILTRDAFRWWDEDGGSTGPDPGAIVDAFRVGDPDRLGPMLFNDLEPPVLRRHPQIDEAKRRLVQGGAAGAVLCGSGPSVAGLMPGPRGPVPDGAIEVFSSPE
jgi:4-diphosphocytidyl-2-C-methyl-D-erythritol kinase